jgi:hypothetical protein
MSGNPNLNPYNSPAMGGPPTSPGVAGPKLPVLGKTLAIIGIVLGSLNALNGCCGILGIGMFTALSNQPEFQGQLEKDPNAAAQIKQVQENLVFYIGLMAITFIFSAVIIFGAAMSLSLKESGRNLFVIGSGALALINLGGMAYQVFLLNAGGNAGPEAFVKFAIQSAFTLLFVAFYIWCAVYFSGSVKSLFR